jgi:hypothetical protein
MPAKSYDVSLASFIAMTMEAVSTSETSVLFLRGCTAQHPRRQSSSISTSTTHTISRLRASKEAWTHVMYDECGQVMEDLSA